MRFLREECSRPRSRWQEQRFSRRSPAHRWDKWRQSEVGRRALAGSSVEPPIKPVKTRPSGSKGGSAAIPRDQIERPTDQVSAYRGWNVQGDSRCVRMRYLISFRCRYLDATRVSISLLAIA